MKKRWILLVIAMPLCLCASAQVPDAVLKGFSMAFPHSDSVKWSEHRFAYHQAHFTHQGRAIVAVFDPTGQCVATGSHLPQDSVPALVQVALQEQSDSGQIARVERLLYNNGKLLYRFAWTKKDGEEILEIDELGEIIGLGEEDHD
jgi:hypothetical protein